MTNEKMALSVMEAAQLLGVSKPTMYTLTRRDDFPAFMVGNRVLISRTGLVAWIQAQCEQGRGMA